MRFRSAAFQDFRNLTLARLEVAPGADAFLLGPNGQGKTNVLEGLNLVSALRSFRTTEAAALVRWGAAEARLLHAVGDDRGVAGTVELRLAGRRKEVLVDGHPERQLGAVLGQFPTVVLSSQDIQLLRGGPALRRRFLDLTLSGFSAEYFEVLRRFHAALEARNALLKDGPAGLPSAARQLDAFEAALAPAAARLAELRRAWVGRLDAALGPAYAAVAGVDEVPALAYDAAHDAEPAEAAGWAELLRRERPRDAERRTTRRGPHRADLALTLFARPAREFGSEGQQRLLVLALRLACVRVGHATLGRLPVLLADDILGELDPARRARFWAALDPAAQVIASGTALPEAAAGRRWDVWQVTGGALSRAG